LFPFMHYWKTNFCCFPCSVWMLLTMMFVCDWSSCWFSVFLGIMF
jgi:hypothetical protein